MNAKVILVAVIGVFASSQSGHAQQQLSVEVINNYGAGQLGADGLGCFDPVSAMRLDKEGVTGAPSAATVRSFEVGTCAVLPAGLYFSSAQEIVISGQSLVRLSLSGAELRIYAPAWAAPFNGGAYQAETVAALGGLKEIDSALKARVGVLRQCKREGDALNARIEDYNARAEEYSQEQGKQTGSRLTRGGASPITRIYLPKAEQAQLYEEGKALMDEAAAFDERCGKFNEGFSLDRDYMAFFNAL